MYSSLMYSLRLLKMFYSIGIYDEAVHDIEEITEDDYYELCLRGLEHVAPIYDMEELGEEHCCGGHVKYHFSDPAIPEFYRLCRLYEYKHGINPEENHYVKDADDYYITCINRTNGDFATNFDNERHPKGVWIETCPERCAFEHELIELVHNLLEYYRAKVEVLRNELLSGPIVWLPALPAHVKQKPKKPRKSLKRQLKKAS